MQTPNRTASQKPKVLFLCTGNSARSQMAEAWMRQLGGDRFEAHSAGLEHRGIHPLTRRVLEEEGLDLTEHRSKNVREYLGRVSFQHVMVVCAGAEKNCPAIFPGALNRHFWPFDDPAACQGNEEECLEVFRHISRQVRARITEWLDSEPAAR